MIYFLRKWPFDNRRRGKPDDLSYVTIDATSTVILTATEGKGAAFRCLQGDILLPLYNERC